MLVNINETNFSDLIEFSPLHIAVVFGAKWCGPCRRLVPALEKLYQQYRGKLLIGELDVDENRSLVDRLAIRGLPSVLFYHHGTLVDRCNLGLGGYPVLKAAIDKILPIDTASEAAQSKLEARYAHDVSVAHATYDAAVAAVQAEWKSVVTVQKAIKAESIARAQADATLAPADLDALIELADQAYELAVQPITQRVFDTRKPAEQEFIRAIRAAAKKFSTKSK